MKTGRQRRWMIATLLTCTCLLMATEGRHTDVIASFEKPDSADNWGSVNDGVMGGVSTGSAERTDRQTLRFTGNLSLENNGGFASIRMAPRDLKLGNAAGIIVKARGDGRTYWVGLRTARQFGASSYRAFITPATDAFSETFIPFTDFNLEAFGRDVGGPPLDPAAIRSIGFTIADKKPGAFELEIESIQAVLEPEPELLQPPPTLSPTDLIQLAISQGVPLFNNGNPAACAAVYEITCEALRSMPEVSADSRQTLSRALARMRATSEAGERAWILRYALDAVLADQISSD